MGVVFASRRRTPYSTTVGAMLLLVLPVMIFWFSLISKVVGVTAFIPTSGRVANGVVVSPRATTTALLATTANKPFAVIVKAKIDPNRIEEFMNLIEINAKASRLEPGCLRFDVLRSQDDVNEFFFYELYQDTTAVDFHKTQDHYNLWANFKASGGALDSISYKTNGEFLT